TAAVGRTAEAGRAGARARGGHAAAAARRTLRGRRAGAVAAPGRRDLRAARPGAHRADRAIGAEPRGLDARPRGRDRARRECESVDRGRPGEWRFAGGRTPCGPGGAGRGMRPRGGEEEAMIDTPTNESGAGRSGSPSHWSGRALPRMRREAHFGDRIVRCFTPRARGFHEIFAAAVAAHGDREALVCGDERYSWRALDERVARVAGGLAERGIGAGDRVALFVGNRAEFVVALFAIQRLGAIAVPIGTREQRDGLSWILGHCGAK